MSGQQTRSPQFFDRWFVVQTSVHPNGWALSTSESASISNIVLAGMDRELAEHVADLHNSYVAGVLTVLRYKMGWLRIRQ